MADSNTTAHEVVMGAIGRHAPDEWTADDCHEAAHAVLNDLASAGYLIVKPTWMAAPTAAQSREAPVWPPK